MLELKLWDPKTPYPKNPAAIHNIAPTTTLGHLHSLTSLQERIRQRPELLDLPLADVALFHLTLSSMEAPRARWTPPSHFRALTMLDGALSNVGKYALNFQGRIPLAAFATWRAARQTWDQASKEHQPRDQAAATTEDIAAAVDASTDPEIRAFIMLLWLMAGRKGDVVQLRTGNVNLEEDGRLKITVVEGKSVKLRKGLYTVPTHCPAIWQAELAAFLNSRTGPFLFNPALRPSSAINTALRVANPALSCRAVRRGAAQAMAMDKDVSEEIIMNITGHRDVKTLHRYLNWGDKNERVHSAAQAAARNNLSPATRSA
jgi:hypothetical protein